MKRIYLFLVVFWMCSCFQEKNRNTIQTVDTPVVAEKKPEAICPLWGNINWKEEDTASGVSM